MLSWFLPNVDQIPALNQTSKSQYIFDIIFPSMRQCPTSVEVVFFLVPGSINSALPYQPIVLVMSGEQPWA